MPTAIPEEALDELTAAHRRLEHPSLAARLSSIIGTPIEVAFELLPKEWYQRLHQGAESAIGKALDVALSSLRRRGPEPAHPGVYKALGAGCGAAGGFFGLPGLLLELPVSTTLMLRAIADVARSEGEDVDDPASRLACMEVFALGGKAEADDAADTGYYGVRLAMAWSVSRSLQHIWAKGLEARGAPAMLELVSVIATRFGVALSEKAAAQMVPVVGAAGGAAVNLIFMQHFQDMARAHFTVRRLEREFGADAVRQAYLALTSAERSRAPGARRLLTAQS